MNKTVYHTSLNNLKPPTHTHKWTLPNNNHPINIIGKALIKRSSNVLHEL